MASSDIIIAILRAALTENSAALQNAAKSLISAEREKKHYVLVDRLEALLSSAEPARTVPLTNFTAEADSLLFKFCPEKEINDLVLPERIVDECKNFVQEHKQEKILHNRGLEPRNKILLFGPPGNGKTSLAEAISVELAYPLFVVRYETLIGKFLGETAGRLNKIFETVKTTRCILFFDEFDTVGKERGDTSETGEMKRVVSTLLLSIDKLPSQAIIIAATNHPELLDRAAWRRFQVVIDLPAPSQKKIVLFFQEIEKKYSFEFCGSVTDLLNLTKNLLGYSFGEIEIFALDVLRRAILQKAESNRVAIDSIIEERLENWRDRRKNNA